MDFEQLNKWRELAQKFYGKDFWSSVFDSDYTKQMMNMMGDGDSPMQNTSHQNTSMPNPTYPRIDILKDAKTIIVLVEIPGVQKNEVQLGMVGNDLLIRGNVVPRYPETTILATERYYGPFERKIPLQDSIDRGKISAKFIDGILEIHCPRAEIVQERINID